MSAVAFDPAKRRADGSGGDELLVTKLAPPRRRPTLIERPRLDALIDEGVRRERPLTLLCAPAGYGKSTAALLWCEASDRPSVWLSLDEDDKDPARLLRYLCTTIAAVRPRVDVSPPAPGRLDLGAELGRRLCNPLVEGEPFTLVLDDLHRVQNPDTVRALDAWLDALPSNVHIVITTREEPELHLARRRARDEVTDIDLTTLRFSADEARAFYKATADVDVDDDVAQAMASRTEGWAAALQLSSISLRKGHDARTLADQLTGKQRDVADYLASEVLKELDEEQRDFLLRTSVCERMCAELAGAVAEVDDGQRRIEELETAGLFIIALDDERRWYRYHHLFAELLRAELLRRGDDVGALHARAARWYDGAGDGADAVFHGRRSGDKELLRELVEKWATQYVGRAELALVDDWLLAFDADVLQRTPGLLIPWVWSGVLQGERAVAERLAAREHDELLHELDDEGARRHLAAHLAGARAFALLGLGRAEEALAEAHAALDGLTDDDAFVRSPIALAASAAVYFGGDAKAADELTRLAIDDGLVSGNIYSAVGAASRRAVFLRALGRFDEIDAMADELKVRTQERGMPELIRAMLGHHELTSRLVRADDDLLWEKLPDEGLAGDASDRGGPLWANVLSAWRRALAGRPLPKVITAAELLAVLGESARNPLDGDPTGQLAILHLIDGHPERAAELLELCPLEMGPGAAARNNSHFASIATASDDERARAISVGRELLADAEGHERKVHVVDLSVALAVALAREGEHDEAKEHVARAREVAEPIEYRGGLPLVLARSLSVPGPAGVALADWLGAADAAKTSVSAPSGEPISERELEVLQLVAEGLSNPAIGKKLFISVGTVKTHVHRLLGKLGADNRTEAARIARERGLLSG